MNFWVWLRVAAAIFVAISACISPLEQRAKPPLDWLTLLGIFAFIPVAIVLVVGFQRLNRYSAKIWTRPSWSTNPFNFRDPIQFFYFGAFLSTVGGIVTLLRALVAAGSLYPEELIPLAMGVGVWLGVKLTILLNPAKFSHRV